MTWVMEQVLDFVIWVSFLVMAGVMVMLCINHFFKEKRKHIKKVIDDATQQPEVKSNGK